MDGENVSCPEQLIMGIIRSEIPYVREDDGEGARKGAGEGGAEEGE
jgi:hypothetical protein